MGQQKMSILRKPIYKKTGMKKGFEKNDRILQ